VDRRDGGPRSIGRVDNSAPAAEHRKDVTEDSVGPKMRPTAELIDAIYREKVLRARRMPADEKLLDGPRLFSTAMVWSKAGIRAQHPEADDAQVLEILRQRFALKRRLEGTR
jgi:hypothetical protein